jgi:hypothetical protein
LPFSDYFYWSAFTCQGLRWEGRLTCQPTFFTGCGVTLHERTLQKLIDWLNHPIHRIGVAIHN